MTRSTVTRASVTADDVRAWIGIAAAAAADKLADDIVVLEVGAVSSLCDSFIICDAPTGRRVKTIAGAVEAAVDEAGGPKPLRIEGLDTRQWVLMDYGDFVVHVFQHETREYYDLERLWSDVPRIGTEELIAAGERAIAAAG